MRRPKLKKASKRLSCSKRYKIQKKVREHHRKLRKEAKKKGVTKRVKKDLGVPSSAPFKEEVLREAEQRRLQVEEEKERKRQAKKEEHAKKRKKDKDAASKETEPKAKKACRHDDAAKHSEKRAAPDKNSKQFLCAELIKVIEASDVVIEVLDARDPLGCRCPQVEEAVLEAGGHKKLLFVLNKIDLVPKGNAVRWIESLQKEFPVVAFKASTQMKDRTVQQAKKSRIQPSNEVLDKSKAAACFGDVCLTELLTSYAANMHSAAVLKVGVVGFPNVGKSSIINSMKGVLACSTGIQRGITKFMQIVQISKNIRLIDSPGIVASPSNPAASMALRSLQVEEGPESAMDAANTLLKHCDKTQIMLQYNMSDFRNSLEFLTLFAKKRGYLQKGGVPNMEQAATVFLSDWTGSKLSYHCKVPGDYSPPAYVTDAVAAEMNSCWDLNKLKVANEGTMKTVRFSSEAGSISFVSKGPTAGLLRVADASEETSDAADAEVERNPETEQTEASNGKEQEKSAVKKKLQKVQFQLAPIDLNLSAANTDDAYDFNTDFK